MKKLVLFSLLAVASALGLQSFGNDGGTPPPTILADTVCFTRDVLPLINSNCAMSNCHDAITHKDNLTLTSYTGIMKIVRAGNSSLSGLYREIANNSMPENPYRKLTTEQKTIIKNWIDQGAKNTTCAPASCDTTNIPYSMIKPIIASNCLGCHDGNNAYAGIDLSTDASVDGFKELILCTIKQAPDCKPMPSNGLKLSVCEQNMISRWVNQSSVGNIDEGTPVVQSLAIIPSVVAEGAVVRFSVEQHRHLTLSLYNYNGQKLRTIASGDYSAGTNQVSFVANDLVRGVYFVRITSGTSTQSVMFTH